LVDHREALSFVALSVDHKTTLYSVDAKTAMYTFGTVLLGLSSRFFLDIRRKASIQRYGVPPP